MSFVPVSGPATFRAGEQPRDGTVEFTDDRRTVSLPMRGALPVLTRAHAQADVHPSVALLSGAALLGMRLVAAGPLRARTRPAPGGRWPASTPPTRTGSPSWRRPGPGRASTWTPPRASCGRCWRRWPTPCRGPRPLATRRSPARAAAASATPHRVDPDFTRRLEERVARARARGNDDRPQLVNIALRVEADEEELVAGAVRLVLQVVAADNAAHVADAALLWTEADEPGSSHGFGDRARTHASIALRAAAEAWPVLDRLLELRVPDQITLDSDELLSLLDEGVPALDAVGVQVLWPRYLDRDVTSRVVLSGPPARPRRAPADGPLRAGRALRLLLAARPARGRAQRRGDGRPGPGGDPDHQDPRQLDDRRLRRAQAGAQAADQARRPGRGPGRDPHRGRAGRGRRARGGRRGHAAAGPRPAADRRRARARRRSRPGWPRRCATTSATASPGWPSSPRSVSARAWPTTWGWARRSP